MGLRVFKRTQYGIGAGLRPQEGKFSLRHENNRTWPWAHAKFCGTHAMRGSDVNKFSTVDSFSTPLRQLGREPGLLTVQIGNTQMTRLRGSPAANDRVSLQLMWSIAPDLFGHWKRWHGKFYAGVYNDIELACTWSLANEQALECEPNLLHTALSTRGDLEQCCRSRRRRQSSRHCRRVSAAL